MEIDVELNIKEKRKVGEKIIAFCKIHFDINESLSKVEVKELYIRKKAYGHKKFDDGYQQLLNDNKIIEVEEERFKIQD